MNDYSLEQLKINNGFTGKKEYAVNRKKPASNPVGLEIITDEPSFYRLAGDWEKLAELADSPVFMSFDWVSSWWKHFGRHSKRRLFILTFYCMENLVGIIPFFEGRSAFGKFTLKKRISLAGIGVSKNELLGYTDDYGYSDFLDAIVHPDYRKLVADRLAVFLRRAYRLVDIIELPQISDNSFFITELLPQLEKFNIPYDLQKSDICPYLPVPENLKNYISNRRSSVRRRFRQTMRAIGPDNWYSIEDVSAPGDIKRGLMVLYRLHQNRWNGIGFPGLFFDDRFMYYLSEIAAKAASRGNLWFKLARSDGEYCAARFAIRYHGHYYDYVTGFDDDSDASKRRPGIGLLIDLIKDAIQDGSKTIELLRGREKYKNDFTSDFRRNWRLVIRKTSGFPNFNIITCGLLGFAARIYSTIINETRLIRVHMRKAGFLRMFSSYGSFRWDSLKNKVKEFRN